MRVVLPYPKMYRRKHEDIAVIIRGVSNRTSAQKGEVGVQKYSKFADKQHIRVCGQRGRK